MTPPQQWTGVGRTETGHVRTSNQDALALLNDCSVWILADGMGGHPAGDLAAQTAVAVATQRARERAASLHEHPNAAAEFVDNPGDINAATAGIMGGIAGAQFVYRHHAGRITGDIQRGVERERGDQMRHAPSLDPAGAIA